jgi:hypothetical protein
LQPGRATQCGHAVSAYDLAVTITGDSINVGRTP